MTRLSHPTTALDAARVIAWRLPQIALGLAKPNARRSREMVRMVSEKQRAAALGLIGAQTALARAWMIGAFDLHRVAAEITEAAERPALDTLKKNVRRTRSRRR